MNIWIALKAIKENENESLHSSSEASQEWVVLKWDESILLLLFQYPLYWSSVINMSCIKEINVEVKKMDILSSFYIVQQFNNPT